MSHVTRSSVGLAVVIAAFSATAAAADTTSCALATACAAFTNTSTGPAVHTTTASGIGLRSTSISGIGQYASTSASPSSVSTLAAAIDGEAVGTGSNTLAAGFNLQALLAKTTPPAAGLLAFGMTGSISATGATGSSDSTSGTAVEGIDEGGASSPDYNTGVLGSTSYGTAILGVAGTGANAETQLLGTAPIGVFGAAGPKSGSGPAYGVIAAANGGVPFESINSADATNYTELNNGTYLLTASTSASQAEFEVDNFGNETLSGTLTDSKGTMVRTAGASGRTMLSYGARTTAPVLEDFGSADLHDGRATVAIDARLHDALDAHQAYHVFLTPDGDCNGLYVAQRGPAGFVVRELRGGRSSLTFEYRIVAKPMDQSGERLAYAAPLVSHRAAHLARGNTAAAPVPQSLRDKLRAQLGPAGFAKAVRAARELLASK